MRVRFHEARDVFFQKVSEALVQGLFPTGQVVVIRDIWGRLSLALEDAPPEKAGDLTLAEMEKSLQAATGPYYGGEALLKADMFAPDLVFGSPDLRRCREHDRLYFLERVVVGADWQRSPLPDEHPKVPRATLHGIKGGVGRSTTLMAWARHLAERGEQVLVIDLDLESPGVSSGLMPPNAGADYGVVDWLVEDAVGNADEDLLRGMAAKSPLGEGTSGSIKLVPCGGRQEGKELEYLAKLSRVYQDLGPREQDGKPPRSMQFADRLAYLIDELERAHEPTVVLIDSRAGIHDLAAITITRLRATAFLFLIGTQQTYDGYRLLFSQWQGTAVGEEVRKRLQVVASQVPKLGRDEFLKQFQLDSWNLFADTLYDPQNSEDSSKTPTPFHFDLRNPAGPHSPLITLWSDAVQQWSPIGAPDSIGASDKSYNLPSDVKTPLLNFLERATELVFTPPERDDESP
mgnify:CR=1 FL=1